MSCAMCGFDANAAVSQAWVCRVQSYCPTVNTLKSNTKNNHVYRSWRTRWEKLFSKWLSDIPPAKKLRRVTVHRLYGKGTRAYDRINFAAGQKPLLDVVANHGAIYDDSELWCQDHYQQSKSPDGEHYMELIIEELV